MKAARAEAESRAGLPAALARLLKRRWKAYCKALDRCQHNVTAKSVHASRIQTRRLLAALELLGAFLPETHLTGACRALKRHLETLADLRDTQVQRRLVARLLRRWPDLAEFDARLARREHRAIKQARKRIRRIKRKKLHALVRRLAKEVRDLPVAEVRRKTLHGLRRALAEVMARRRRIVPDDPATIHRTRVAFKHFRYMVESLYEALAELPPELRRTMRAYQTLMGDIQDHQVLSAALEAFAHNQAQDPGRARLWLAAVARRRRRLIARFLSRADEVENFCRLIRCPLPTADTDCSPP